MLLLFRISTEPFYTRFNEVTQNVRKFKKRNASCTCGTVEKEIRNNG